MSNDDFKPRLGRIRDDGRAKAIRHSTRVVGEAVRNAARPLRRNGHIDPNAQGWFDVEDHPVLAEARRTRLAAARTGFDMGLPFNDLNKAFDKTVELLVQQFGFYQASIFLMDRSGKQVEFKTGCGSASDCRLSTASPSIRRRSNRVSSSPAPATSSRMLSSWGKSVGKMPEVCL